MKKIIYTLLVAVLAFSFMGCPTVHTDLDPQLDLTGLYLKGEADGWGDGFPLEKQADGTYTVKFVAPSAEMQFKVATPDWSTAYPLDKDGKCGVIALGEEAEFFAGDSGFDNPKVTGLVKDAEYTMVVTPLASSILIKVVGEAAPAPTPDEEEAVLTWPPVALPINCFAVKVEGLSSDGEKTWNSNISWGGAVGTWAGDDYVKGTGAITVSVIDGAGIMYISNDYAADGWALSEAKPDTNFKLATGDGADRWFKIEKPAEGYCVINWTDGVQ